MRQHFQELTQKRYHDFTTELRKVRKNPDAEHLHDLRVATRRLIAALAFKSAFYPEDKYSRLIGSLEDFMKPLGKQRDLLLQEALLQSLDKPVTPGVRLYLADLTKKIQSAQKEVKQSLTHFNQAKLSRKIHQLPLEWTLPSALPGNEAAPDLLVKVDWKRMIREKLELVLTLEEKVLHKKELDSFHKMRIRLKELRYWLEMLESVLPWITKEELRLLQQLQRVMGDIHDLDVLARSLMKFSLKQYPSPCGGIQLAEFIEQLRINRNRKFNGFRKKFDQFGKRFSTIQD